MRIETPGGNEICNFDDWAKIYDTPKEKVHWKKGRSAYSAAEFIMNRDGVNAIRSRVSEALNKLVTFERVVPEHEVRFDKFGKGRIHDIGMYGTTDTGESVFVGVEAKVDEPFGPSVLDAYLAAKVKQISGTTTNAPERIEKLLTMHFPKPDKSMFDLRYQLLYATAGTISAGADISVLYVIVFDTSLYDASIGEDNYRDYMQFMSKVGATPLELPCKEAQGHGVELQGEKLTCLYEKIELSR